MKEIIIVTPSGKEITVYGILIVAPIAGQGVTVIYNGEYETSDIVATVPDNCVMTVAKLPKTHVANKPGYESYPRIR